MAATVSGESDSPSLIRAVSRSAEARSLRIELTLAAFCSSAKFGANSASSANAGTPASAASNIPPSKCFIDPLRASSLERSTAEAASGSRATPLRLPELREQAEPQRDRLGVGALLRGLLAHRGVHHHELGGGVDHDDLAADAHQRKAAGRAWKQKGLVAIAEIRRRRARRQRAIGRERGGVQHPLPRNQLAAFPGAVMRKQPAEPGIVAQHRVEAAERELLSRVVDHP